MRCSQGAECFTGGPGEVRSAQSSRLPAAAESRCAVLTGYGLCMCSVGHGCTPVSPQPGASASRTAVCCLWRSSSWLISRSRRSAACCGSLGGAQLRAAPLRSGSKLAELATELLSCLLWRSAADVRPAARRNCLTGVSSACVMQAPSVPALHWDRANERGPAGQLHDAASAGRAEVQMLSHIACYCCSKTSCQHSGQVTVAMSGA